MSETNKTPLANKISDKISETGEVTITGAGLAGALMAIYLARRGFTVHLFEKRADMRKVDIPAGRSINLALAERGLSGLRGVGLDEQVLGFTVVMRGRMLHDRDGQTQLIPYGTRDHEVIWSVPRGQLNMVLLDAAEATGRVHCHFETALVEFDPDHNSAVVEDQCSGERREIQSGPILAADGGGSAVRNYLAEHCGVSFSEDILDHSYKELTIPPTSDGGFRMESEALHIWPRGGYMTIALPNNDGSFTVTLFMPNEGEPSFTSLEDPESVRAFFASEFADTLNLIPELETEFFDNPTGFLGTVRTHPWHLGGRVALMGDAAHAVVPFHGQGMNCAFEDVVAMDRCIELSDTWSEAFERYQRARINNGNAIADMALENYIEMRDSVRDERFQLKKKLEAVLETRYPDRFIPRYSMVMFHRLPYALAQSRGRVQAEILHILTEDVTELAEIDLERAGKLIGQRLGPIDPDDDRLREAVSGEA